MAKILTDINNFLSHASLFRANIYSANYSNSGNSFLVRINLLNCWICNLLKISFINIYLFSINRTILCLTLRGPWGSLGTPSKNYIGPTQKSISYSCYWFQFSLQIHTDDLWILDGYSEMISWWCGPFSFL